MTDPNQPETNEAATRGLVSSSADSRLARAVIYLCVSTKEQAEGDIGTEGFSIPAQREACRRKAQEIGAAVVDEYVDRGESARSADRPALQSMLTRLRLARDVDHVIVHKIDRLARSREDDVSLVMEIRTSGAALVSVSEHIDETPSGKLMHGILATFAEFYSTNLSAEARKGMEQKAKVGGTIGLAPMCYRNTRIEIDGREVRTVEVDEERAPLIRWAFEAFASGDWTIASLREELEVRGLTARPTRRYPSQPLSRSRVHKMLHNPYYVGMITYNGVLYRGRHAPLIALDLFDDVQTVLRQRSAGGEKPIKRTHYLKGMLHCGRCGERLGISFNTGRQGSKYPYFFCLGRHGHKHNGCQLPYLPMEQVESDVERFWDRVRVSRKELDGIRRDVTDLIQLAAAQHEDEIATQRDRLRRLDAEEGKLLQAHHAEAVSLNLLQKEQKRILGERAAAEGLISALSMEYGAIQRTLDEALGLPGRGSR